MPYQDTSGPPGSERGFDFSFGVGKPVEPSIGYFTVNEVANIYNKKNGTKSKVKRPLKFGECGTSHF